MNPLHHPDTPPVHPLPFLPLPPPPPLQSPLPPLLAFRVQLVLAPLLLPSLCPPPPHPPVYVADSALKSVYTAIPLLHRGLAGTEGESAQERERERGTESQRDRATERQTERERERERGRERERTVTQRDTHTHTHTHTHTPGVAFYLLRHAANRSSPLRPYLCSLPTHVSNYFAPTQVLSFVFCLGHC
jgi:hypothetical protein